MHICMYQAPQLLSSLVGQSEANLQRLFEAARAMAPCVVTPTLTLTLTLALALTLTLTCTSRKEAEAAAAAARAIDVLPGLG